MSKFKSGDVVRRIGDDDLAMGCLHGGIYVVDTVRNDWMSLKGVGGGSGWHVGKFELINRASSTDPHEQGASPHTVAGVQPHSQGGLYPFVIVYRDNKQVAGSGFDDKYDTGVQGPGIEGIVWFKSRDAAHAVAEQLLEHRA